MKQDIIDFKIKISELDCKNHWYAGVYRNGMHVFNECSRCSKRQFV